MRDGLTFEDGIIICKHIYQCAIEKTLNGVIEQEEIFYKTHDAIEKVLKDVDRDRLDELLSLLNMENVYISI